MIARLCGLGLDARRARRPGDVVAQAHASRWIAGNLLAIRGVRIDLRGVLPAGAHVIGIRVRELTRLIAALAAVPAVLDAAPLPLRWQVALRALGIPVLDQLPEDAVRAGASVLVPSSSIPPLALHVDGDATGYRIEVVCPDRRLAA